MSDSRAASPGATTSPRHRPPPAPARDGGKAAANTLTTFPAALLAAEAGEAATPPSATAAKRAAAAATAASLGVGGAGAGEGGPAMATQLAPLRVQQHGGGGRGAGAAATSPGGLLLATAAAAAGVRPAVLVGGGAAVVALSTAAFTSARLRAAGGAAGALYALYYQPPLVALAMLWLWIGCVAFFESRHIRYDVCFSAADRARLPRAARLARLAAIATALAAGSGAAFAAALAAGSTGLAAMHPPALYAGLTAAAAAPLHVGPAPAARLLFVSTAARVATPVRPVSWSDFLLADVATSLAAPLAGGARAVCHAVTRGVLAPPDEGAGDLCGRAGPVALAAAAAPFAARLSQCVRVWADTGATPQLWNALKYGTAFPALLAAAGYERARDAAAATGGGGGGGAAGAALAAWVAAQALNTCFSYFWDVERDWEIRWFTRMVGGDGGGGGGSGSGGGGGGGGGGHGHQPPSPALARSGVAGSWAARLAPPAPALPAARTLEADASYHWLLASNAALRLAWLARTPWAPGWARAPLAPAVAGVLEAARRAQWIPVRVEVELRRLQDARPELGQLVPPPPPGARSSSAGGGGPGSGGRAGLNTPRGLQAGEGRSLLPVTSGNGGEGGRARGKGMRHDK